MRFSIISLFGLVAYVAFACIAMLNPTLEVTSVVCLVLFTSMLLATLAGVYSLGGARAFWTGVAIFGWACSFFPESRGAHS